VQTVSDFWFRLEVLLKSKTLGIKKSNLRFKYFMFAMLAVVVPFIVIYCLLQAVGLTPQILFFLYLAVIGLLMFLIFVTSVVIFIIAMKRIRQQSKSGFLHGDSHSKSLFAVVRRKSYLIAIEIGLVGAYFVVVLAQVVFHFEIPAIYLGTQLLLPLRSN
jgi:hypothetical protein